MKYCKCFIFIISIINVLAAQQKGASPLASSNEQSLVFKTFAVVVGISDYQDPAIPDLRYADKDAIAFANYLRSAAGGSIDKDHLKLLINSQATMAQFANALDWLIENVKEADHAIIYFSGHGDVEKKTISQPGFFLCWDAPARVYMAGGAFALPMLQEVISTLSIQNKAKVLVIADACHSGTLAGNSIGGSQATTANLAKQFGNEIKIMSCQPNEYSIEGEQWGGGRGAFSFHLIDALYGLADSNNDNWVTLQEVGRYLEDHVSSDVAPVSQVPMIIGNRNERLNSVDEVFLASIRSGKTSQMAMLSAIDSKGIEEDVLSKLDSNIRRSYELFKGALKNKNFLDLKNLGNTENAEGFYQILIKEPRLERLHTSIKRNYAAALQDDAQQVLNKLLNSDLSEMDLTKKSRIRKYQAYPRYLERAAELLGKQHYMYSILEARRHYFEGYVLSLTKQNFDKELGERILNEFRLALQFQPDLPYVYLEMSSVFANNFLKSDSSEYYALRAASLAPSWVLPYTNLAGLNTVAWNKPQRAKYFLKKANEIDSNSVLVLSAWGIYYTYQFQFEEAEMKYLKVIQSDPSVFDFNNLGMVYKNMQRYEEAELQLKKAIQMDSTLAVSYFNLALVYIFTNRNDEAEQQYKRAISVDSNYTTAYLNLGLLYLNSNRISDAEKQFRKVISLDSMYSLAYNNLGFLYANTNRLEEAEQLYKKAIQIDSSLLPAYGNLGALYANTGRFNESEIIAKKIIQLYPKSLEGYNLLGMTNVSKKQYQEGERQFKIIIQLDSTFVPAYYNLACIYSLQNFTEKAFEFLELAIKKGYNYFDAMQQDSDLTAIREKKDKWNELMKKYFNKQ